MTYEYLAYLHLATVTPAGIIGTYLILARKGSTVHRGFGKAYMILMLVTASICLLMPAQIGFTVFDHFGPIHILSFMAIISVITAYSAIRKGNISRHRKAMIGLYFGGVMIAGAFTFMPGRLLHSWLFG